MRKTAGAIAVAAAVAGVGGAAIAAATGGGLHATSAEFRGGPAGPPPPAAHRSSTAPDSLHGEYVVADGHGGFSTLISQTGRVTSITATSVTARSDDGFVQTYVLPTTGGASTPPVAVNDQVTIDARREGATATVITMQPPPSPGH